MRHSLLTSFAILLCTTFALADTAALDQPAPAFTLPSVDGKNVSLSDYSGKIVVLEWINPECPFVQRHYKAKTMTTLAQDFKGNDVVWLAIATSKTANADKLRSFATEQGISYPILLDADGAVARAYGAKTTPHMFIVGTDGKLVYRGAIDNDPDGDKSQRVNYVRQALDEIIAGKPVSHTDTKPYGCSVKF